MSKLRRIVPIVSNTASNDVAPSLLSFTSSLATEILRVLVWPVKNNQSSKIPTLVKIEFLQKNKSYIWIVEPNISYASN